MRSTIRLCRVVRHGPTTRSQPTLSTRGLLPSEGKPSHPLGLPSDAAWAHGPRSVTPTDDGGGEINDRSWEHRTVRHRRRRAALYEGDRSFPDSSPRKYLEPTHTIASPSLHTRPRSPEHAAQRYVRRRYCRSLKRVATTRPRKRLRISSSLRFRRCDFLSHAGNEIACASAPLDHGDGRRRPPSRAGPRVKGRCS
jgi:hypothetical protein